MPIPSGDHAEAPVDAADIEKDRESVVLAYLARIENVHEGPRTEEVAVEKLG